MDDRTPDELPVVAAAALSVDHRAERKAFDAWWAERTPASVEYRDDAAREAWNVRAGIAAARIAELGQEAKRLSAIVQTLDLKCAELELDAEDSDATRQRMSEILTGVARVLKGEPEPMTLHSWHDLEVCAEKARDALVEAHIALMQMTARAEAAEQRAQELLRDKALLDSGRITLHERDEFGDPIIKEVSGLNLRAAIGAAVESAAIDAARNGQAEASEQRAQVQRVELSEWRETLIQSLKASKGWMTGYAEAFVDEGLDRMQFKRQAQVQPLSDDFVAKHIDMLPDNLEFVSPYFAFARAIERACAEAWGVKLQEDSDGPHTR